MSIAPSAITTEVSIRPQSGLTPKARGRILIEDRVDVFSKLPGVDIGSASERLGDLVAGDEMPAADRPQLPDRDTVAGDDELFTAIQFSHDLSALVAQLALAYLACHYPQCSTGATAASAADGAAGPRPHPMPERRKGRGARPPS